MAFKKTASLKNGPHVYKVNPNCKPYTLRDYGFLQTRSKNYNYEIQVSPEFGDTREITLKVSIAKDLSGLSLLVTSENGLKELDIYTKDDYKDFRQPVQYILDDMVERNVLAEVAD